MRRSEIWLINLDPTVGAEIIKEATSGDCEQGCNWYFTVETDRAPDRLERALQGSNLDSARRS